MSNLGFGFGSPNLRQPIRAFDVSDATHKHMLHKWANVEDKKQSLCTALVPRRIF
jgi:hypothetical protein